MTKEKFQDIVGTIGGLCVVIIPFIALWAIWSTSPLSIRMLLTDLLTIIVCFILDD